VIGVCKHNGRVSRNTLKHELSHALFFKEREYRHRVKSLLQQYDMRSLESKLWTMGYCRQVMQDELHAYLLAEPREIPEEDRERLAPLRKKLIQLYRQFSRFDIVE
jgi:hypothetical protein